MSRTAFKNSSGWLRSYTIVYLVFIYLPILFLPLFSFNSGIYVAFPMSGFTLHWWTEMISQPGMHKALGNSVAVALHVCLISTTLGLMGARALTTYKLYGARALTGLFTLPLVNPFLIMGIALLL